MSYASFFNPPKHRSPLVVAPLSHPSQPPPQKGLLVGPPPQVLSIDTYLNIFNIWICTCIPKLICVVSFFDEHKRRPWHAPILSSSKSAPKTLSRNLNIYTHKPYVCLQPSKWRYLFAAILLDLLDVRRGHLSHLQLEIGTTGSYLDTQLLICD